MKAKFFLLGLCVLGLAACSVDEVSQVNDTNAVTFKAATATRAAVTTTNNLNAFTVWAWNGEKTFMDAVTATNNGSGVYETSPLYYWPSGTVDFYAISPAGAGYGNIDGKEYWLIGGEISEGDDEDPTWTYTGNVGQATIADGDISIDVCIPGSHEEQIDLLYAVTTGQKSGTVGMNFRHALSQVVFKASNTSSEQTIRINGVSVCSAYKTGTYHVPAVSTTSSDISGSRGYWDVETEGHKARFAAGITSATLEGISDEPVTLTSTEGSLFLLPQTVAGWDVSSDPQDEELGSYFRVSCNITSEGNQLWPSDSESNLTEGEDGLYYAEIAIPCDIDWEEGYRYTYTFIFGEGAGYYPPDDPNTDLGGTPILVPVRFTVGIDDFNNTDINTGIGGDEGDEGDEDEPEPDSLVLEYTTTEESTSIALPILSLTDVTVDWGDGSDVEAVSSNNPTHTYSAAGTYTVTIDGTVGELSSYVNNSTIAGADCLTAVKYWGNMAYTSFENAFRNCTNLASVPKSPIPFSDEVRSLRYAFNYCSSLTEVPVNMFENAKGAEQFSYLFQNCSKLVNAPSFDGFANATDIVDAFQVCSALVTLPENMFRGCAGIYNFSYLFQDCASLTTVPEGIFDGCTEAQDFGSVFSRCYALETVPTDIFDSSTQAYSFNNTFRYCESVTVESPYTEIEVDGVIVKVHLYERENYPDYFKPLSTMTHNFTFGGSSFSDIDSIPSSWGGNGN